MRMSEKEIVVKLQYIRDLGASKAVLYSYFKQNPDYTLSKLALDLDRTRRGINDAILVLIDLGYLKRTPKNPEFPNVNFRYTFLK